MLRKLNPQKKKYTADYFLSSDYETHFLFIKSQSVFVLLFILPLVFYRFYQGKYAVALINFTIILFIFLINYLIYKRNKKNYALILSYFIPLFYVVAAYFSIRLSGGDNLFLTYAVCFILFFSIKQTYAFVFSVAFFILFFLEVYKSHSVLENMELFISYFFVVLTSYLLNMQMQKTKHKLNKFSSYDSLTQARNKQALLEDSRRFSQLNALPDFEHSIYMLLIDADDFNQLNEKYGYFYGDHALAELKNCLDKCIGAQDMLYYLERDRFIVVSENTDEHILLFANHICDSIAQAKIHKFESVSVSIGVKKLEQDEDFAHWFEHTQLALKQAKKMGKSSVAFA